VPSSNPALNARTFANLPVARIVEGVSMTLEGTAAKTAVLALCVAITALFAWIQLLF